MTPDRSDLGHGSGLNLDEVLRLLQQLVLAPRTIATEAPPRSRILAELEENMQAFCQALELKRAAVYEALYDDYFEGLRLSLLASSSDRQDKLSPRTSGGSAGRQALPIASNTELFTLISEGQCIPLGLVNGAGSAAPPQTLREAADFMQLGKGDTAVLFPLASSTSGRVRGVVLMERAAKSGGFSENLLDLGSITAQMLEPKLMQLAGDGHPDDGLNSTAEAFERRVLPVVVINRKTLTIERVNDAAVKFLTRHQEALDDGAHLAGRRLAAAFPGASHFIEVLEKACAKNSGPSCFSLSAKDLSNTGCAFALISFVGDGGTQVWLQLIPEDFLTDNLIADTPGPASRQQSGPLSGRAANQLANLKGIARGADPNRPLAVSGDDAVAELSRRLTFERWLRQTICKLHSSLDRDYVLQTLADSLGRAFRATRCLVIRTEGPSYPMVTHEYEEPDLSPLGLGRTGQFPTFAISLFAQKTVSYGDVAQLKNSGPLSEAEVEQLLENGILSMAGAPLSYQGQPYGVLILVDGTRPRRWTDEELETIELAAFQASVSLSHSQTYHQAKDQLFHMNLLGNLTQQLTNALEVATKAPSAQSSPARGEAQSDGPLTPLSSRELEVLRLIASGYANREIAQRLFLTESTVELHASRIRKKLHLKSRTALVKYACDYGLV